MTNLYFNSNINLNYSLRFSPNCKSYCFDDFLKKKKKKEQQKECVA